MTFGDLSFPIIPHESKVTYCEAPTHSVYTFTLYSRASVYPTAIQPGESMFLSFGSSLPIVGGECERVQRAGIGHAEEPTWQYLGSAGRTQPTGEVSRRKRQ